MSRSSDSVPDGRRTDESTERGERPATDDGASGGTLSRRTTLALLGLGVLGAGATRSAAKPDTDRWKKDQDAQGNDLVNLGDLSFAAAPGEHVSSIEDLRLDVRDIASNTTIPGVETLSIGSGLVATSDETGATVSVERASESGLGAAVAMTERQTFDGTEPEPWLEWNQVDFVHPDVVTFEDETFTVQQDGIYDLRVSVTVLSSFRRGWRTAIPRVQRSPGRQAPRAVRRADAGLRVQRGERQSPAENHHVDTGPPTS